jgi:lysozyme
VTSADLAELRRTLIDAEGLRLKPYVDTVGKMTVGVGRNLTDVGLSKEEVLLLLENDISRALHDCERTFPWFQALDPVRQRVIVEMRFQLGLGALLEFTQTLGFIERGEYESAATTLLKSKAAVQTPKRWKRLAQMMKTGAGQT